MSEQSNKSIRVRTTNTDTYIPFQLNQDFDFLNIMSLTLTQDGIYSLPTANYGVIVGRVTVNGGVGVPNVKVTIFVPLDEEDEQNDIVSSIYPYKSPTDKDSNGIRYNLLPNSQQHYYHSPVGTFPSRDELVSNPELEYIHKKYYKYCVTTNSVGDYMIMGVPTGEQTIFMDCDISDIGYLSQKPYDFINQGYGETMFESKTKFKQSTTIETLPQIFSQFEIIDIKPFWGDEITEGMVGINRKDFSLNYKIIPTCMFIGSMARPSNEARLTNDCLVYSYLRQSINEPDETIRVYPKLSANELIASNGKVEITREKINGEIEVITKNNGSVVDENGVWCVQIEMNQGYKTIDEFGNEIDGDETNGVPTYANVRIRIGSDISDSGQTLSTASYLIPCSTEDFRFDLGDYADDAFPTYQQPFNGVRVERDKIYTIKTGVGNFQRVRKDPGNVSENLCMSSIDPIPANNPNNPFPYNVLLGKAIMPEDFDDINYGYGFIGLVNGFVLFIPFENTGGGAESGYCNCKQNVPEDIVYVYIPQAYNYDADFNTSRNVDLSGAIYHLANKKNYYYCPKPYSTPHHTTKYLYTFYSGIVEIGYMDKFSNPKLNLPPTTSHRLLEHDTKERRNRQCELGVANLTIEDKKKFAVSGVLPNINSLIQNKGKRVLMMRKGKGGDVWFSLENEDWKDFGNIVDNTEYDEYVKNETNPNSFFYYFGIKRGLTAIDKLIKDYLDVVR